MSSPFYLNQIPFKTRIQLIRFANYLKAQSRSLNTIKSYLSDLKNLFSTDSFQNHPYLYEDPESIQKILESYLEQENLGNNTARRYQMTCRTYSKFLQEKNPQIDPKNLQQKTLKERVFPFKTISDQDYQKLLKSLQPPALSPGDEQKNLRDRIMIQIIGELGLKVSELTHLKWKNFHLKKDLPSLLLIPGARRRSLLIAPALQADLLQLKKLRTQIGLNSQAKDFVLFGWSDGQRQAVHEPLNRHGLKFILNELGQKISQHLSCEMLRNYAIFNWIREGLPPEVIRERSGLRATSSLKRFFEKEND